MSEMDELNFSIFVGLSGFIFLGGNNTIIVLFHVHKCLPLTENQN
jgi:hypothetical protein